MKNYYEKYWQKGNRPPCTVRSKYDMVMQRYVRTAKIDRIPLHRRKDGKFMECSKYNINNIHIFIPFMPLMTSELSVAVGEHRNDIIH